GSVVDVAKPLRAVTERRGRGAQCAERRALLRGWAVGFVWALGIPRPRHPGPHPSALLHAKNGLRASVWRRVTRQARRATPGLARRYAGRRFASAHDVGAASRRSRWRARRRPTVARSHYG